MEKKKLVFSIALLLLTLQVFAQTEPTVLSIEECIIYASQSNRRIKVAELDEEIAQKQVKEVRGSGLPQINVNGNFEDRLKIPLLVLPPEAGAMFGGGGMGQDSLPAGGRAGGDGIPLGYQYNTALVGELTQQIINPAFWVGLKAAKASKEYYEQAKAQVNEQVAYNVADAYYGVIVVQQQIDLLETTLENSLRLLELTELQYENGVAKLVDVKRIRVNTKNLESQLEQAQLSLVQTLNNLKFQMGMPLEENILLSDTTLTFTTDIDEKLPEEFYRDRLDYQLLETNLELRELDRRNFTAAFYPTLQGFANYGYQAQGPEFGFFKTQNNDWVDYTTSSIGLRLNIPVFSGLSRLARVEQATLRVKQVEENLDFTRQSISLEAQNALIQYKSTIKRINAEQENVELAREVFEITQLEFREGVTSSSAIVEAESSLREAQNIYLNTLLDLYNARLDFELAKGSLLDYLLTSN